MLTKPKLISGMSYSKKFQEIMSASFVCTFGYDDHSRYIYEHAFPVHQAHDAPGTFFITTGRIEEQDRSFGLSEPSRWGPVCTWEELREMHTAPVGAISVENHTHSHPNLSLVNDERLYEEFQTSQDIFKKRGFTPKYTSYPYGAHNDLTKLYASAFFKAGRGVEGIAKNDAETDRFNTHSYNLDTASFSFVEEIIQGGGQR